MTSIIPTSLQQAIIFGNGSDGDVTISGGVTTLTRDMHYDNLTIDANGFLGTNGYRVFVKTLLSMSFGGMIFNDANPVSGSVGRGGIGGSSNNPGESMSTSLGGAGSDGAVSPAGSIQQPDVNAGSPFLLSNDPVHAWLAQDMRGNTIQGGSGGGQGTSNNGQNGGGVCWVAAKSISGQGMIRASGGNASGDEGSGGGGVVILLSRTLPPDRPDIQLDVSGGIGAASGSIIDLLI